MKKQGGLCKLVVAIVLIMSQTACSFGGKEAGNVAGEIVSGQALQEEAVPASGKTDGLSEAEHEALSKAVLSEKDALMKADSTWAYHDVKYLNTVESHEVMGVEDSGKLEKKVYLFSYWAAYGKGSILFPDGNCYDERGTSQDLYVMTLKKKGDSYAVSDKWNYSENGKKKEDKRNRKSFHRFFPEGMEEDDVMFYYHQTMAAQCHQKALAAFQKNEKAARNEKNRFKKKRACAGSEG